jgi:hypothetical protein
MSNQKSKGQCIDACRSVSITTMLPLFLVAPVQELLDSALRHA